MNPQSWSDSPPRQCFSCNIKAAGTWAIPKALIKVRACSSPWLSAYTKAITQPKASPSTVRNPLVIQRVPDEWVLRRWWAHTAANRVGRHNRKRKKVFIIGQLWVNLICSNGKNTKFTSKTIWKSRDIVTNSNHPFPCYLISTFLTQFNVISIIMDGSSDVLIIRL